MKILFFGSTSDSVIVLNRLFKNRSSNYNAQIIAVVTQPPAKVGRKQITTPTPVEQWSKEHGITCLSFPSQKDKPWLFENDLVVTDTLETLPADLAVTASFGQKIPWSVLSLATYGGLNVHPSLLPRWRGGDPVPWTILAGDRQTGVSVTTLAERFDEGQLLAQKKIPVSPDALPDGLRTELFEIGADLLIQLFAAFKGDAFKGVHQDPRKATYARRLTRSDGFVPWDTLRSALDDQKAEKSGTLPVAYDTLPVVSSLRKYQAIESVKTDFAVFLERMVRALFPWPGVWTLIRLSNQDSRAVNTGEVRLKILKSHLDHNRFIPDSVQLEGKTPASWDQFSKAYRIL